MAKILVIDDEEIIRNTVQKLLELDDYETFTAANGLEGLEVFRREDPDVAIVDIKMPGMDGIEVLRTIRAETDYTQVILCTGHGGVETAIEALREGAFGYIQKPVEYDELEIEVRRAIDKNEMQRKLDQYVNRIEAAYSELEQIFNTAGDGMIVIDPDFTIIRASETYCELAGVSRDEVVGRKCHDVFPGPKCHTEACARNLIHKDSKRLEAEAEKTRRDGRKVHCMVRAVPWNGIDGDLQGVIISYTDVTSRKAAEVAVRESEEKYRGLFQQFERDFEIAEKVFENIVTSDIHLGCPNIKRYLSPMTTVAGDLVCVSVGPTGSQYIFVGDFTGHGLSAAIGAIPVSSIFYAMAEKGYGVSDIVLEVNRKLKDVLPTGLFLCACLIELNYAKDTVHLWNGGLPDVLITTGTDNGIKHRIGSTHLPLGVVSGSRLDLEAEVLKLDPGDRIYACSDGIIEATNKEGEMFGAERLEQTLLQGKSLDGRFEEICTHLADFQGDVPQNDDMTLVEIRYDPASLCKNHWKYTSKLGKVSTGWKMALEMSPDDLRNRETFSYLVDTLIGAEREILDHRENIFLIMAELFTNALDYGVLGLDPSQKKDPMTFAEYHSAREKRLVELKDGYVKIAIELLSRNGDEHLIVRVEDSGPGYDYNKSLPTLSENIGTSGRGVQLVRSICRELNYHGKGNIVEAVYKIS